MPQVQFYTMRLEMYSTAADRASAFVESFTVLFAFALLVLEFRSVRRCDAWGSHVQPPCTTITINARRLSWNSTGSGS